MSESETDMEFLDGLIGRPITVSDRVRLFALARRGVEAAAEIERLHQSLHDTVTQTQEQAADITRLRAALREIECGELTDRPIETRAFARAALGGENE